MDPTVVFIVLFLLVAVWLAARVISRSRLGGPSRRRARSHSGTGYPHYVDGSSGSSDDRSSSNDSGGSWWGGGDSGGSWGGGDSGGSWGGGGDSGGGGSY